MLLRLLLAVCLILLPLHAEEVEFETPLYDAVIASLPDLLGPVLSGQASPDVAQTVLQGEIAAQLARITDTMRTTAQVLADLELSGGSGTPADLSEFHLSGTEAELPSAEISGRIYIAHDTRKVFLDSGAVWTMLGYLSPDGLPGGGGGGTGSPASKVEMVNDVGQLISQSTDTLIDLSLTAIQEGTGLTPDLVNDRITVSETGYYFVVARLSLSGTDHAFLYSRILIDGEERATHIDQAAHTGGAFSSSVSALLYLTAGQHISFGVRKTAGNQTTFTDLHYRPSLSAYRVF